MARTRAAHLGPELRRPLVLDAALPMFARDGYDAVSMQAIADAAGVSKPVLYSCFASKEELFDELLRREDRRLWDLVEDAVPPPTPGVPEDQEALLRNALTGILRAVQEAPDSFRVLYIEAFGEDRVARGRAHWEHRMAEVLAAHSDMPDREASVLGRLLVATAELGFRIQLDTPGQWDAEGLAAFLSRTLMRGMLDRG